MSRISSNPVGGFKKVKALLLGSTSTSGAGGDEGGRGPDSKDSLASKGVLRVITTSPVSEVGNVWSVVLKRTFAHNQAHNYK